MIDAAPRRVPVRLPAAPDSVGSARAAVRHALTDAGLDHLVETALLLVSEVATNAVLHARTGFEVRVSVGDDVVRVSVLDGSSRPVSRRRYGLDAGTGRGIGLVDTLSSSWGATTGADGWAKAVWFELSVAGVDETVEGALYGEDWLSVVEDL